MAGPPQYPNEGPVPSGRPAPPPPSRPVPPPAAPPPSFFPPPTPGPGGPAWGQAPNGQWVPVQGAYSPNPYATPFANVASTNGLAVASLVVSIAGIVTCGLGFVLGIIFGFVARSQIKNAAGRQKGEGLALAGIIIGVVMLALGIGALVLAAVLGNSCGGVNQPAC